MSRAFDEIDFREMIRQTLVEARASAHAVVLHDEQPDASIYDIKGLLEAGDEFGDVFGDVGWKDFTKVIGDPGKVKDAVVGSALKVGAKARTLLSVILRGIPSLVIPFIRTRYDRIYARERAQMDKIRQRYPDVFKNADQLFTNDAKLAAFMINPVLMTAAAATQGSVDAVLGLTSALGAGDTSIEDQVRRVWRRVNRLSVLSRRAAGQSIHAGAPKGNEDLYYEEGIVLEASRAQQGVVKLLRNKQLQERLSVSRVVQDIKGRAEDIKNETLNDLISFAQEIRQLESIDGLRTLDTRGATGGAELARKLENQVKDLEPSEAEPVIQASLKQVKDASLKALVEKMRVDIESLRRLGVPDVAEVISAYEKALSRIESSGRG